MTRALITTVPFGEVDPASLGLLDEAGIEYVLNPIGRRLTEDELVSLVPGFDVLIAGTEPITERVMEAARQLRLISRVGVGLDNVDLLAARARGIAVAYTPEGPADAVAELTIGLALSLLRGVYLANAAIRQGVWQRIQGRRLAQVTVGVVGVGRIGRRCDSVALGLWCPHPRQRPGTGDARRESPVGGQTDALSGGGPGDLARAADAADAEPRGRRRVGDAAAGRAPHQHVPRRGRGRGGVGGGVAGRPGGGGPPSTPSPTSLTTASSCTSTPV